MAVTVLPLATFLSAKVAVPPVRLTASPLITPLRLRVRIVAAVVRSWPDAPVAAQARRLIDLFPKHAAPLKSQLESAARLPVRRLPCLRDIWHDHVLFTGAQVTGLIDFGALRTESPAADVARLLGSLVGDDVEGWRTGVAAYRRVRPLTENELRLVEVFDYSNVLLAGMNWLRWLCLEGRQFARMEQVIERLEVLVARLEHRVNTEVQT